MANGNWVETKAAGINQLYLDWLRNQLELMLAEGKITQEYYDVAWQEAQAAAFGGNLWEAPFFRDFYDTYKDYAGFQELLGAGFEGQEIAPGLYQWPDGSFTDEQGRPVSEQYAQSILGEYWTPQEGLSAYERAQLDLAQQQLGLSERELALQEREYEAGLMASPRDWIERWYAMNMPTQRLRQQPSYPTFDGGQMLTKEGMEAAIQMETGFDPRELYNIQLTTGTLPVSVLQGYRQAWEPYVTQERPTGEIPLSQIPGSPWAAIDVTQPVGEPEEPVYIPCNSYEDFVSKFYTGFIYPNLSANYPMQVTRQARKQGWADIISQYGDIGEWMYARAPTDLVTTPYEGFEWYPPTPGENLVMTLPQETAITQPATPPAPEWLPTFVPQLTAGEPIEPYPITTPSGQLWSQTPYSVRQGLAGYADWAGYRPIEDVLEHLYMMQPKDVTPVRRWTAAYARA